MRVLAVDTTTPRGSLALVDGAGVQAEARVHAEAGHSRWLLPAVDALLQGLELPPDAIDVFAVTTGPGSFTGVRVGLSTVQGLALASGRPCVAISALEALALATPAAGRPVVALRDAFRGELYWAAFERDRTLRTGPHLGVLAGMAEAIREAGLATTPGGVAFVGELRPEERATLQAFEGAVFPEVDPYLAAPLGRAALVRATAGLTVAASELRPLYIRGVDIRAPRP